MTVTGSPPSTAARRARAAVAAIFFANGAVFANVVPRYPQLKAELELSNAAFGSAVAGYGLGALLLGLTAGALVSRLGSARVAWGSTFIMSFNVVLFGVSPSWWALTVTLFLAGSLDSIADIAVNAHGLRVERLYRRSILNAFHGLWSIGAVVGGGMGAAAAGLSIPLVWHLSAVAAIFAAVALTLSRFLLPGPDDVQRPSDDRAGTASRRPVLATIVALATIAGAAQLVEDIGATWSAVYLREELAAGAAVAGFGFIALQGAQTVGRLLGDRLVTRYGDRAVARAGAALAGLAMGAALTLPSVPLTVCAFGAAGLGIGTLIPASLRMVDGLPGLAPGVGLTWVALGNRVVLLAGPPLVGAVADLAGLRVAFVLVPVLAALVITLSPVLSPGPRRRARGGAPAEG